MERYSKLRSTLLQWLCAIGVVSGCSVAAKPNGMAANTAGIMSAENPSAVAGMAAAPITSAGAAAAVAGTSAAGREAGAAAGSISAAVGGTSGGVSGASGAGGVSGAAGAATAAGAGGADNPGGPVGTGPGDWVAGDYPPGIDTQAYLEISGVKGQGTYVRQYKVHVPPTYDPKVPTPLVFCIHGLGQDPVMFCVTGTELNKTSDDKGFILVMPNGYQNSWNGGTCCGGASSEQLDDVALFRAIFEELKKHVNVDLRRVYATGLSNGAYMSYRLGCDAADIFAAVAPGAGAIGKNDIGGGTSTTSDFTTCEPSRPVSVLDLHGMSDGLIPYALQAPSLMHMAAKNGCGSTTMPAVAPTSTGDTACVSYVGCPSGVEVTGCSITGGGHCWFGSPDCGTGGGAIGAAIVGANSTTLKNNDAIWDFFVRSAR
jgi:polyhydroxybutyrate depolymerase